MTKEIIDLINQIDTAHYITYLYGCIFLIALITTCYFAISIPFAIITKKKKTRYLEELDEETQNKIRKYEKISVFTKEDKK